MPDSANSEHRAMGWAAIGGSLSAIGGGAAGVLAAIGAGSHLWGDVPFLVGFAAACALTLLGVYVLVAEFIGGIGPVRFRLPLTRREREAQRRTSREKPLRVLPKSQRRVPVDSTSNLSVPGTGMTRTRREKAIKQYKQTLQREADQRDQIKRELREDESVSPEHRDMLRGVARHLLTGLRAHQTAYYGGPGDELKARSFQEHFSEIRGQVETWNARIDARERARDELRGWVASRLHAFHYDQPPYGGGLDLPIAAAALVDAPRLAFSEVHGCLQLGPHVIVVLPSMKEIDPNWGLIPDVDRTQIERELQEITVEAAGRPERQNARDAERSLPEVGEPLSSELRLIQEKDVIRGLGDCVLCQ
jgi:hypothetical protein